MNPTELIRRKRDGASLTRDDLRGFIAGYLEGSVTEYQMSAFLMAVYFRGMSPEEAAALTEVMLRSGRIVDLSGIPGPKVDKHSTGGVGDKVSLILAPMVAACGVFVPMVSGRGLGHTGGTLDKLESIPGMRTDFDLKEYGKILAETGCVMIGQTAEIAPADKRMYALRDVTATVESIPLIAGSIMSKKLAEGIDAVVFDVKRGRGAFMESPERALELARTLVAIAREYGKKAAALITDMSQPLGFAVGNWLEVRECIDCLNGSDVPDLMEVTYALGSTMLVLGGASRTLEEGFGRVRSAVSSGAAMRKFKELVGRQGGDVSMIDHPDKFPLRGSRVEVKSDRSGYVEEIDTLEVGYTSVMIGAGRMKIVDRIDPSAGIVFRKKRGSRIERGDVLCELYSEKDAIMDEARARLAKAFRISDSPPVTKALIDLFVDESGAKAWQPLHR